MTYVLPAPNRAALSLPAPGALRALMQSATGGRTAARRLGPARMFAELYAIGIDRLVFALAVAVGMFLAGWLLGRLELAPMPMTPELFLL